MRTCCCSICHQQGHNRRSCPSKGISKSRMDSDSKDDVPTIHCEDISVQPLEIQSKSRKKLKLTLLNLLKTRIYA
jgi:hypothetical protein